MSDLISRSALIEAMEKKYDVAKQKAFYSVGLAEGFIVCEEIIKEQPTVEAVPVVRGKWIKGIYGWHCSECVESFGPELYYECGYKKPNFCPNCGARMVKDNE